MSDDTKSAILAIEARLSQIEQRLNIAPVQNSVLSPALQKELVDSWADDTPSPPTKSKPSQKQEPETPVNWLGYTAIICFILAAGLIVKLSIDSGWLTPVRQIGISALFGVGLIGAGLKLMSTDRAYASLLPSAGVAVLYLTVFAAHRLYNIFPFESSLILVGLISALCVGLFARIRHDIYNFTACAGAFLSPVILNIDTTNEFSLYYFLICSIGFSTISVFVQSRTLILVASSLSILMTGLVGADLHQDLLVAYILGLNFFIFVGGTFFYSVKNKVTLTTDEAWSLLPVMLIFYAVEYSFIDRINEAAAPWISIGFAAILLGIYTAAKNRFQGGLASQNLIVAFTTLTAFHSVYIELMPNDMKPWLLAVILFAFAFTPASLFQQSRGKIFFVPVIALIAVAVISLFDIWFNLANDSGQKWNLLGVISLAGFWACLLQKSDIVRSRDDMGYAFLGATHITAIMGFYGLTHNIGSLAVSASWLFYAVAVMGLSTLRKDITMARSALFVLAFAAGKALLYDASSAATMIRIFCLLLTGAVLYGCGLWMRKISSWEVSQK